MTLLVQQQICVFNFIMNMAAVASVMCDTINKDYKPYSGYIVSVIYLQIEQDRRLKQVIMVQLSPLLVDQCQV